MQQLNIKEYMYETQYAEFLKYTEDLNRINELKLPGFVSKKIEFIRELGEKMGSNFKDLAKMFRDKKVFKIFSVMKWSFERVYDLVKRGYKAYNSILKLIPRYVASTRVGEWTNEKLRGLDRWLQDHPTIKKMSGVVVAGILIYIWLNMSFTGDFFYDMGCDDIVAALSGSFSLANLFSGEEGLKLLMLFATGVLGASFPWPGAQSIQFVSGFMVSVAKLTKNKVASLQVLRKRV